MPEQNNILTEEEHFRIKDYIFLTLLLNLIDKNIKELQHTPMLTLKSLYTMAAETLLDRVHADMLDVKKYFREHKIKVEEADDHSYDERFSLRYKVYFRGYNETMGIMKDIVKGELGIRLGKYIGDLGRELRNRN